MWQLGAILIVTQLAVLSHGVKVRDHYLRERFYQRYGGGGEKRQIAFANSTTSRRSMLNSTRYYYPSHDTKDEFAPPPGYRQLNLLDLCTSTNSQMSPNQFLGFTRSSFSAIIILSHYNDYQQLPAKLQKCRVIIQAESRAKLSASFSYLSTLDFNPDTPFVCYMYLRLTGSFSQTHTLCGSIRGSLEFPPLDNHATVEWVVNNGAEKRGGFKLIITAYRDSDINGVCPDKTYYGCSNHRCVLQSFVCDGYNNCGDGSDEKLCLGGRQDSMMFVSIGILSAIGLTIVICALRGAYASMEPASAAAPPIVTALTLKRTLSEVHRHELVPRRQ